LQTVYKNDKNLNLNKKFWQWAAFLAMSFIWGASFILIKKGLLAYTPMQSGALRMTFASLFFLPLALSRIKKINKQNIIPLLITGFIGNFFPAFMFAYGETKVTSTVASMLNSTTPIFTLIIGVMFFKMKANSYKIIGLLIGFVGTMGLIIKDGTSIFSGWNIGALIILAATFFYGINTNVLKSSFKDLDGISISALSFMLIGPFAMTYFFSSDLNTAYQNPHFWTSTLSLATLSFFGSFLAVIIFNTFIQYTSAILAASVTYVIPVFALFWGILDNETITIVQIISALIVFIGISFVNKKEKKPVPVENN
jgi:drug/metabolite transporter (DMT)-like permease